MAGEKEKREPTRDANQHYAQLPQELRSRSTARRSAICFASARSCFLRSLNPGDARKLTSATWRSEYNSSTRPASTATRNCAGT